MSNDKWTVNVNMRGRWLPQAAGGLLSGPEAASGVSASFAAGGADGEVSTLTRGAITVPADDSANIDWLNFEWTPPLETFAGMPQITFAKIEAILIWRAADGIASAVSIDPGNVNGLSGLSGRVTSGGFILLVTPLEVGESSCNTVLTNPDAEDDIVVQFAVLGRYGQ